MAEATEIIMECLGRIRTKYIRRGKPELWDDITREEFLRAFSLIPVELADAVTNEMLMNPPTDDRGREINWLPDPSDIVRIAKGMRREAQDTPSAVVSEIMGQISAVGWCGAPKLSGTARKVVDAYGGWMALCSEPVEHGVLVGMLRKFATDAIEQQERKPLLVPILNAISANGNGRKAIEAKR